MLIEWITSIKHFPEWINTVKAKNRYLYYSIGLTLTLILILLFNFFTVRSFIIYSLVMVVFPTLWLIGHLILLHYWQRKNVLSSLFAPRRMIAMPLYSTLWSDTLGSMMILYMVHGFDGSQNDYLYVLWLTFFIKIGLYLAITKRHKRGYLWMDILFLMVGFFLTFIIYSLAATV